MVQFSTLNVDHYELVIGLLEGEVAEGLGGQPVHVRHKARVGVVLDVAAVNEVFHPIQGTPLPIFELNDISLAEIHLQQKAS